MELELRGKSNIRQEKWYKSELLDREALPVNTNFKKIVLLQGYSTQINKYNPSSYDLIYDLKDGKGLELQPRSFAMMDTSNAKSITDWLDANKGKAVWLEGSLIQKGDKTFINVNTLKGDKALEDILPSEFESQLFNYKEVVEGFELKCSTLPQAIKLYEVFKVHLNRQPLPVKGTSDKAGASLKYLTLLMDLLNSTTGDKDETDNLITMEMLYLLKQNNEISKKDLVVWCNDNLEEQLYTDVLFGNPNQPKQVQMEMLESIRRGVWIAMSYQSWNKLGGKTHFNPITKEEVRLKYE